MFAQRNGCLMRSKEAAASLRAALSMARGLEQWLGRAWLVWLMRPNDIFAMLALALALVLVLVLV